MKTTVDKAGRIVLPKVLRDAVGITAGEVEVYVDGATLRIEPVFHTELVVENGFLTLPPVGTPMTVDELRELRLADQR